MPLWFYLLEQDTMDDMDLLESNKALQIKIANMAHSCHPTRVVWV